MDDFAVFRRLGQEIAVRRADDLFRNLFETAVVEEAERVRIRQISQHSLSICVAGSSRMGRGRFFGIGWRAASRAHVLKDLA